MPHDSLRSPTHSTEVSRKVQQLTLLCYSCPHSSLLDILACPSSFHVSHTHTRMHTCTHTCPTHRCNTCHRLSTACNGLTNFCWPRAAATRTPPTCPHCSTRFQRPRCASQLRMHSLSGQRTWRPQMGLCLSHFQDQIRYLGSRSYLLAVSSCCSFRQHLCPIISFRSAHLAKRSSLHPPVTPFSHVCRCLPLS